MHNIEMQKQVDKSARTVEKQERHIEALESQVGEINAGRSAKSKVGGVNTTEIHWIPFIYTFSCPVLDLESTRETSVETDET